MLGASSWGAGGCGLRLLGVEQALGQDGPRCLAPVGGLQEERLETEPSFGECLPPRPRGFESTVLLGAVRKKEQPRSGAACLSGEGTARQDGFSLRPRTL